jgi:hypothetical protein
MNPSGHAGVRPVEVAMDLENPLSVSDYAEFYEDGNPVPMAAGRVQHVGSESCIWVIFMIWRPGQTEVVGQLKAPERPVRMPPFRPHPAVADNLREVLVDVSRAGSAELSQVENTTARQVWKRTFQADDLWVTQWYYVYNSSREIRFSMQIVYSSDSPSATADLNVNITCGEDFVIDHADLEGVWHSRGGYLVTEELVDGGAWRCWGRIACREKLEPQDATSIEREQQEEEVAAILAGPVYGGPYDCWGERYMGWYTPEVSGVKLNPSRELQVYRRKIESNVRGEFYDPRPLGLNPQAGGTGDQEDFGLVKGTMVFAGFPDYIGLMRHSFMDGVRGVFHLDGEGDFVRAEDHPDWRTWSSKTHFASQEKLGRRASLFYDPDWAGIRSSNGQRWTGIDDQHRSQNNAVALAILTGDHMVLNVLEAYMNVDMAMYPSRVGAPRAIGRLLDCWVKLLRVLPEMRERFDRILQPKLNVWTTQLLYHREEEPQLRVAESKSDPRLGIYRPENGWTVPEPAWSVWEHGLMLVGLASACRNLAWNSALLQVREDIWDTVWKYGSNVETPSRSIRIASTRYYPPGGREVDLEDWMVTDAAGAGVGLWVEAGLEAARPFKATQVPKFDVRTIEWFASTPRAVEDS